MIEQIKYRRAYFMYADSLFSHFSEWGTIRGGFKSPANHSHAANNPEIRDQLSTGQTDESGVEIFEGDYIRDVLTGAFYEVKFGHCWKHAFVGFYLQNIDHGGIQAPFVDISKGWVVIGNVFEGFKIPGPATNH
jgi:hypothetical protein